MSPNKRIFGKALLLILLVTLLAVPVHAAQRMAISGYVANVRSGPGLKYEVLWQVQTYHPFLVVKKKGLWYRVKDYEGDYGWIHSKLLNKTATIITKSRKCNVRKGPGTKYPIAFTSGRGVPYRVLDRNGNWIKIQHEDGDKGWIFKPLVW